MTLQNNKACRASAVIIFTLFIDLCLEQWGLHPHLFPTKWSMGNFVAKSNLPCLTVANQSAMKRTSSNNTCIKLWCITHILRGTTALQYDMHKAICKQVYVLELGFNNISVIGTSVQMGRAIHMCCRKATNLISVQIYNLQTGYQLVICVQ